MGDAAERWGVIPRYTGYQGHAVESPASTIDAIVNAMSGGRAVPPDLETQQVDVGRCTPPPDRGWGWAIQLYAARSKASWGIGDLADLRRLGRWARSAGASVVQISPLGAQPPTRPYQACPYYSSSRRFGNITYLAVEEIEGAERAGAELAPLKAQALALNSKRLIDHDAVFALKSQALDAIFHAVPQPRGLAAWQQRQGRALVDFATFDALVELHGAAWRSWPSSLQSPRARGIEQARAELAERVAFHQWAQFHLHRQLARASREITLTADVPVGFAADGFDAWRWQDLLAPDMRVGAPPDYFFPDGQDWGMPPFDPWKLRAENFEPFVDAVRATTVHAKGLRLDHVMSLFRLFWIPQGGGAAAGAYVRYPSQALLAVLAAESRRSGSFVIGEDLGLVEPSVKTSLQRAGALGYRLLWFEAEPSESWPHLSVAAIGTHDLPTVAGIWRRTEPDHRQHHLRSRLVEATGLADGAEALDVAVAAYRRLAKSKSCLVLASLEDALAVDERPNVPGTTTEWPNWRLALPFPLEEIERADGPGRIAEVMAGADRSSKSRH
ncbi:MAG TPA: 4-alpha-glucanotransferase [Candidatus Dormibacteraeota bacterium]|nr:4-alpha-glucanotransferase [Candidatus Dormibacteraeota bacterium]